MKLITKNTDYAMRALLAIAQHGGMLSATELVRDLNISRPFLRKILMILNKEGFLHSCKGKGGGFTLAKPAHKIFVTDLIRIFQGPVKLNDCIVKLNPCPDIHTCVMRKKIKKIEDSVVKELRAITIQSLL